MTKNRDITALQEAIAKTDWAKFAKDSQERADANQRSKDKECSEGNHERVDFHAFAGNDIIWVCSNCKRAVVQIGGNLPMAL